MAKNKYPRYGLAIVGAVLAIWAGMPPIYLLFLACPVMMFFMMSGMNSSSEHDDGPSRGSTRSPHTRHALVTPTDRSTAATGRSD